MGREESESDLQRAKPASRSKLKEHDFDGKRGLVQNVTLLLYPLVLIAGVYWLWYVVVGVQPSVPTSGAHPATQPLYTVASDFTGDKLLLAIRSWVQYLFMGAIASMSCYFLLVLRTTKLHNQMMFPTLLLGLLFFCALLPARMFIIFEMAFLLISVVWLFYTMATLFGSKARSEKGSGMMCHTCGAEDYACKTPTESNLYGNPQYWKAVMEKHKARGEHLLWFDTLERLTKQGYS